VIFELFVVRTFDKRDVMMSLWRRLVHWLRRSQHEADLAAELETHRALKQEALERAGYSLADAEIASRRALGNVTLAREDARRVWVGPFVEHLAQDVRYGLRALRRQPLFTGAALATLALGLGAAGTVLSVVDAELSRPLPWPESDRVVAVSSRLPSSPNQPGAASVADYLDWRASARTVDDLAAWQWTERHIIRAGGRADSVRVTPVTPNFLTTLRIQPVHGRGFDEAGSAERRQVVLSDAAWRRLLVSPERASVWRCRCSSGVCWAAHCTLFRVSTTD
jgi:putative ABC transport system permease protein